MEALSKQLITYLDKASFALFKSFLLSFGDCRGVCYFTED